MSLPLQSFAYTPAKVLKPRSFFRHGACFQYMWWVMSAGNSYLKNLLLYFVLGLSLVGCYQSSDDFSQDGINIQDNDLGGTDISNPDVPDQTTGIEYCYDERASNVCLCSSQNQVCIDNLPGDSSLQVNTVLSDVSHGEALELDHIKLLGNAHPFWDYGGTKGEVIRLLGPNDQVQIQLDEAPSDFSISFWFKLVGFRGRLADRDQILLAPSPDSKTDDLWFGVDKDDRIFSEFEGRRFRDEKILKIDEWVFVTLTKDRDRVLLYVDGKEYANFRNPDLSLPERLVFGGKGRQHYIRSVLDELRVYPYVLEPQDTITLSNRIKGSWNFENRTELAKDEHYRNQVNAALDAQSFNVDFSEGVEGNAASFNGIDSKIELSNRFINYSTRRFALSMWIKLEELNREQVILGHPAEHENNRNHLLALTNEGRITFRYGWGGKKTAQGIEQLETGVWYHILIQKDYGTYRVFLDGELDLYYESEAPRFNNNPLVLGQDRDNPNEAFKGRIDQLMIYHRLIRP